MKNIFSSIGENKNVQRLLSVVAIAALLLLAFSLANINRTDASPKKKKPAPPAVSIEAPVFTTVGTQGANDFVDVLGHATGYWPTWEIPGELRRVIYVENPKHSKSDKVLVINGDGRPPAVSDAHLFDGSVPDQQIWGELKPVSSVTLQTENHQEIANKLVHEFKTRGYNAKVLDGEVVGIPSSLFHFVLVSDSIFPSRLLIVRSPETSFPPGFFQPWTPPQQP